MKHFISPILNCWLIFALIASDSTAQSKPKSNTQSSNGSNKVSSVNPPGIKSGFLPLYRTMKYEFNTETDMFTPLGQVIIEYRFVRSFKSNGGTQYGYQVFGELTGADGNVYLQEDAKSIVEFYELPDIRMDYEGTRVEVDNIFKAPSLDNLVVTPEYSTNIQYNTGNYRKVTLLRFDKKEGESWTEETIADMQPAIVQHTILKHIPEFRNAAGKVYKDFYFIERKVSTASPLADSLHSRLLIMMARGVGVLSISSLERNHFLSDLVRYDRGLKGLVLDGKRVDFSQFPNIMQLMEKNPFEVKADREGQQGGLNKLKGIWKLIKTGNEGLATNIDEYLGIAEYGKGEIFYLRKANSGLYEHGQGKEFAWSVWSTSNKISNDIYFNLDRTRSKGDLIEFTSNSKRQLIWKGKQYEYFGEDISYY